MSLIHAWIGTGMLACVAPTMISPCSIDRMAWNAMKALGRDAQIIRLHIGENQRAGRIAGAAVSALNRCPTIFQAANDLAACRVQVYKSAYTIACPQIYFGKIKVLVAANTARFGDTRHSEGRACRISAAKKRGALLLGRTRAAALRSASRTSAIALTHSSKRTNLVGGREGARLLITVDCNTGT